MSHVIGLIHEEGGAFGISFPDFPGGVSGGGSLDEAIARGAATLTFHVAGMIEDGDLLPAPRSAAEIIADRDAETNSAALVAVPVDIPGRGPSD